MFQNKHFLIKINIFLTIMDNLSENIWKKHISVLLKPLVDNIEIFEDRQNIIVDCTLWMAGHFIEIAKKSIPWTIMIGFDADIKNLNLAKQRIIDSIWNINFIEEKKQEKKDKINIILINDNFWNIKEQLENRWIQKITWIYYDLWLSSLHLDEADRGFSFMKNWPLDMRLDKSKWQKASEIVNSYTASKLREIFLKYWESSQANKIANKIIDIRKKKKFETTNDLTEIIAWPPKEKAKIFQALRIEVNKELEMLEKSLKDAIELLEKDWRIFVISFHSLEDRITKQIFKKETRDCICSDLICSCHHKKTLKLLNKKPILPSEDEIKENPRSRSAKARAAQKI